VDRRVTRLDPHLLIRRVVRFGGAGFIATEMVAAMPEDVLAKVIATIPVGRLGEPAEIARVVEFLADPDSGYITGEVYGINGGLYM
jgi:acetoacetyl-CoA reductase